jgi:hypothetical protein
VDADDVALSFCAVSDIDDWQLKPTIEMKTAIFSLSNITHKLADAYFIQLNVVQEKEVNYQWEVER